jgi:hypothetical protein
MKLRTYFFQPTYKMGSYSLRAKDNADALVSYNEAAIRSADHDGDERPIPLAALPRGTCYRFDGDNVKRFVRFPQAWEFEVRGVYAGQECEVNTCKTYADAKRSLNDYRENDKGIPFRIVKVKAS